MIVDKPERTIDDRLELLKSITEIHSTIKDVVSADFLMSKLTDKEKEYIVEMTSNAFLSRKLLLILEFQGGKYFWNGKKWEWMPFSEQEKTMLKLHREATFDAYMNKIYMLNIVNRNVPKNYIIEKLTGIVDAEEERPPDERRIDKLTRQVKEKLGLSTEEKEK